MRWDDPAAQSRGRWLGRWRRKERTLEGTPGFRFREADAELLRLLRGEFTLLVLPGQTHDLLERLKAAGLVEPVTGLETVEVWK